MVIRLGIQSHSPDCRIFKSCKLLLCMVTSWCKHFIFIPAILFQRFHLQAFQFFPAILFQRFRLSCLHIRRHTMQSSSLSSVSTPPLSSRGPENSHANGRNCFLALFLNLACTISPDWWASPNPFMIMALSNKVRESFKDKRTKDLGQWEWSSDVFNSYISSNCTPATRAGAVCKFEEGF